MKGIAYKANLFKSQVNLENLYFQWEKVYTQKKIKVSWTEKVITLVDLSLLIRL